MRKILMLDVDGVLNIMSQSYTTAKNSPHLIERHLVSRLNYLCEKVPDVEIVVSSSWRFDMPALEEDMVKAGFAHWDKVTGKTTIARSDAFLRRGEEIRKWLDENIASPFYSGIDGILAILDDESAGIVEFWDENKTFFKTDSKVGLTDETVLRLIEILSDKEVL